MIKNRHFMLGLGSGLIAGALLLQLMLIGQGGGALYTREQIRQAAEQAGLKVVEGDQELLTEEEWLEKSGMENGGQNGAAEEPDSPVSPQNPSSPGAPNEPVQPGSGEEKPLSEPDQAQADSPVAPSKPAAATVEYKIAYGSTLDGVAEGLYQSGVISDKEAFLDTAKAKKINYKVRTGTYTFQVGEDFSSIIAKISPQSSKK